KGISRARGEAMLIDELVKLVPWVIALCPTLYGKRLAAILDFTYNLGIGRLRASTLRKRINAKEWESARIELLKWNKGGGKVLPGLVRRREVEARLISS
ncbi:MAG: lysozyme, partial [Methylococcaceae bacterium]